MKIIRIIPVILLFFTSCDDFIETNISEENVILLSPQDNMTIKETNITFWWEEIEKADSYNIQVVSGSFSNIQKLIFDSTVYNNTYTETMDIGNYAWRVKAINSISETEFSAQSFLIDTTESK